MEKLIRAITLDHLKDEEIADEKIKTIEDFFNPYNLNISITGEKEINAKTVSIIAQTKKVKLSGRRIIIRLTNPETK